MTLLKTNGVITAADDKTNLVLPFTVDRAYRKIIVSFAYAPKTVEDTAKAKEIVKEKMALYGVKIQNTDSLLPVKNLVTLSFDENGTYRGACHRQPNEQTVTIAAENSTPGILNREVQPGDWQTVLNVHYAGCDIHYTLRIEGVEA